MKKKYAVATPCIILAMLFCTNKLVAQSKDQYENPPTIVQPELPVVSLPVAPTPPPRNIIVSKQDVKITQTKEKASGYLEKLPVTTTPEKPKERIQ